MRSRYSEPDWLAAIPARGWVALFSTAGRSARRFGAQPVVAWADTGEALVVDRRKGCLVPATANTAFVRLEPSQRQPEAFVVDRRQPEPKRDAQGGASEPEVDVEAEVEE